MDQNSNENTENTADNAANSVNAVDASVDANAAGNAGTATAKTGETDNFNPKAVVAIIAGMIVCLILGTAGNAILPEWVVSFFAAAVEISPFVILAILAYASKKYDGLKIITTIWLLLLILGMAFVTFGMGLIAVLPPDTVAGMTQAANSGVMTEEASMDILKSMEGQIGAIVGLFFGVVIAGLLALTAQIRAVRVWISRYIPIDPDSFVHKTALTTILAIIFIFAVPLIATGQPPLTSPNGITILSDSPAMSEGIMVNVYSLFWMIFGSMLIAGLFVSKTAAQVCERLGLRMPTAKEFALAIGVGVALVIVFHFIDTAISMFCKFAGLTLTDSAAVNKLFSPFLTPFAAILAAISAGFGEEIGVRGLLQERFGILIPTALFAMLHAFQYNWDGVLSVFFAGFIFAILRKYYHTTFTAITHSIYDLILFYMIIYGITI